MAKEEKKKTQKKKPKRIHSDKGCLHDFAHCRYDKKNKCNVYQCCLCGQFRYQ